jgi:hypothetical protein
MRSAVFVNEWFVRVLSQQGRSNAKQKEFQMWASNLSFSNSVQMAFHIHIHRQDKNLG